MGCLESDDVTIEDVPTCEAENVKSYKYAELSDIVGNLINGEDGHPDSNTLKQYLSAGEQLYHKSTQIDGDIKCFEACIRRPYFHVNPLDCSQLDNWHKYLDFVEHQGDFDWVNFLKFKDHALDMNFLGMFLFLNQLSFPMADCKTV